MLHNRRSDSTFLPNLIDSPDIRLQLHQNCFPGRQETHEGGRYLAALAVATTQKESRFVDGSESRILRCDQNSSSGRMLGRWKLDEDAEATTSSSSTMFSMSSDDEEEEVSSSSSSSSDTVSVSARAHQGPLHNMNALYEALPIKRGLSRHFSGKTQSFTSLAKVLSVVDLAKPGSPFVRKRKTGNSFPKHGWYHPRSAMAAGISKRPLATSSHCRSFYVLAAATSLHHDAINQTMAAKEWNVFRFLLLHLISDLPV